MKHRVSIAIATTVIVTTVNVGSIQKQAIANANITTRNQRALNSSDQILLAQREIVCPPGKPCYSRGRSSINLKIISPYDGKAMLGNNNRPMLSWLAVPGEKNYSIRIAGSKGNIWDTEINLDRTPTLIAAIPYPEGKPALEPDQDYTLIVESKNDRKLGSISFRLLSQAETQRVQTDAQTIITNTKLDADEKALKLVALYRDHDNITEAIEILNNSVKKGSRNVLVYQTLGDLYFQVGLPSFAENSYKRALDLATTINDRADAQVGLGYVNVANKNWELAINFLLAAHASYETLHKLDLATQVAQFLGQVYKDSGKREQAIYWYQQAKAGYQALNDEPKGWQYVETELKTLNQ